MSDEIKTVKRFVKMGVMGLLALVGLGFVLSNVYTVDEGDRYIIVRLGEVNDIQKPGLRFKLPLVEDKYPMSVRVVSKQYEEFGAKTSDNQRLTVSPLVPYRLDETRLRELYINYGVEFENRLMRDLVVGKVREELGKVNIVTLASQRAEIGLKVGEKLAEELEPYGVLIQAENVKLADLNYSESFNKKVDEAAQEKAEVEKMVQQARKAQQQAIKKRNIAKGEADARREQADGEAYYTRETATADADAIRLRGDAEAAAIAAKGAAIRANPQIVSYVKATAMLQWNGQLPSKMIPSAALPILDVGKE